MAIFAPAESLPNPATLVGINGRLLFHTEQNWDYLVQVCFFVLIFSTLFFRANCSTPLGIKRILFLLQQNRDSLVKVCYLCLFVFFACLFLYSVWTPLGIYFYWSKIETLGLWRTNLAAGEQNSLSSDCRLLVQKTNLPQMKPETWNDCHTLQNAPRWL